MLTNVEKNVPITLNLCKRVFLIVLDSHEKLPHPLHRAQHEGSNGASRGLLSHESPREHPEHFQNGLKWF